MSRVFNRFGFFAFLGEKPKGGMLYVDLYLFWRVVVDVCCVNKKKGGVPNVDFIWLELRCSGFLLWNLGSAAVRGGIR